MTLAGAWPPAADLMPAYPVEAFPTLAGALTLRGPGGTGLCFHLSAALLLDLSHGSLCIGALRGASEAEATGAPGESRVPFLHCWVEQGPWLFAPTTIAAAGGLYAIPRGLYYESNGIAPAGVHRINRAALKRLARDHGWTKARPFGNGQHLAEPLGKTLLRAMRIPHTLAANGGVLP